MDPAAETRSCPHCGSQYLLVRVKPDPGHHEGSVSCVVCDRPMPAWDGDYALKYFRVSETVRERAQRLQPTSHSSPSPQPPR
jgi:hypothetical protein